MAQVILWSGLYSERDGWPFTFQFNHLQRPIGSYQLAWWLRKHRFRPQVIEYIQLMTPEELIDLTERLIGPETLCIGMATTFWPFFGVVPKQIDAAIKYFRQKYPHITIVGGGRRVDHKEYEGLFDVTIADVYGEDGFLKWCQEKKSKVSLPNQLFDITRLEHRFVREDIILPNEALPIELGRGCMFHCKFCNHPNLGRKRSTYQRQYDLIVDEMKYNYDEFGTTFYAFLDDTANEDIEKVRYLATVPQQLGFDMKWTGYIRADLIYKNMEQADLLRESGMVSPFFGIETFHPKASSAIGKVWSGKFAKDWLPYLHRDVWEGKINIWSSFIIGLPYEPISSYYQTFKWCRENTQMGTHFFFPLSLKAHASDKDIISSNPGDYGFELNSDSTWKSDMGVTSQLAHTIAGQFNNRLKETNKNASFRLLNWWNITRGINLPMEDVTKVGNGVPYNHAAIIAFKNSYIEQFKKTLNLT